MKTKRSPQSLGTLLSLLVFVLLLLSFVTGCVKSQPATTTGPRNLRMPQIPANYYACVETTPNLMISNYFESCSEVVSQSYNGRPFVLKNITVVESMLKENYNEILWLGGLIKCQALTPGDVGQLQKGDIIDIVGINQGKILAGDKWEIVIAGCLFLPAESVALPGAGGATWEPMD